MRRNFYTGLLASALALASVTAASGQTAQQADRNVTATATARATSGDTLPLPSSDSVALIDVQRLLNEALPRVFANNPARINKINSEIDNFKTRTGIDARSFQQIAIGARLTNPSAGVTKFDNKVAIARGTFNAGAIAAAARVAASGKYQEMKHGGKTIYVFTLNEQVRVFGLANMRVRDLAVGVLNENTLAVGELEAVRASLDASAGRATGNSDLLALAMRRPNAIISFGSKVPPDFARNLDIGNAEIERNIASVKHVFGALGTTAQGFDMQTVLRTGTAPEAKDLNDTLVALKTLAPALLSQVSGQKGQLARNAVNTLNITSQGNEVQLNFALAAEDVTTLVGGL